MNLKITSTASLVLLFSLAIVSTAGAEGFVELRGGLAWFNTTCKVIDRVNPLGDRVGAVNDYSLLGVPSFDLLVGWTADPFLSVIRVNVGLSDTNATFYENGVEPVSNSARYELLHSSWFHSKNYSLSFTEYLPIRLFKKALVVSPCLEIKIAHYLDPSAGSEFIATSVRPASDHWFSFLKAGLKIEYKADPWAVSAEYKYPFFGVLTDNFTLDNRREDAVWAGITYNLDKIYFTAGYEGSAFVYSHEVRTGNGEKYVRKNFGTVLVSLGLKF
jgi:hypothetical protein